MAKIMQINTRVNPDVKAALTHAAGDDRRTVSSLIDKIVSDWLIERGYLPDKRTLD